LDLYIWLSNKYENAFFEREKAVDLKKKTIEIIDIILEAI